MLTWIWDYLPENDDTFYVSYDYDYTSMSDHLLMGPNRVPEGSGTAAYNGKRYSAKRIRSYGSLNTASNTRVVHERMIPALSQAMGEEEYQLYPATIIAKGGERIHEYFAVVPLHELTCTDVNRSEITGWLMPKYVGKVATNYKSLAHLPDCLGQLDFARDSVTGLMVVSEKFKATLEATKERGLCFQRPENMQTWMY